MLSMLKFYFLGFLWFPIFSDESVSDNFWFVGLFVCLFVCLFICFSHLYSCFTHKLRTRVLNSQIFWCTKYMQYMFHFLILSSIIPLKSNL